MFKAKRFRKVNKESLKLKLSLYRPSPNRPLSKNPAQLKELPKYLMDYQTRIIYGSNLGLTTSYPQLTPKSPILFQIARRHKLILT